MNAHGWTDIVTHAQPVNRRRGFLLAPTEPDFGHGGQRDEVWAESTRDVCRWVIDSIHAVKEERKRRRARIGWNQNQNARAVYRNTASSGSAARDCGTRKRCRTKIGWSQNQNATLWAGNHGTASLGPAARDCGTEPEASSRLLWRNEQMLPVASILVDWVKESVLSPSPLNLARGDQDYHLASNLPGRRPRHIRK